MVAVMTEISDQALDLAASRGGTARGATPRARAARHDAARDALILSLTNGVELVIPVRLVPGLGAAPPVLRDAVDLLGAGYGLHWEALDLDLSVPELLAELCGARAWVAGQAGRATSPAKAAAARANGALGGRPRRD